MLRTQLFGTQARRRGTQPSHGDQQSCKLSSFNRPLHVELLEDRRLLANVTVSNLTDNVNGNVTSIANLVASPGADGISLREAIQATNATAGTDTIQFASALTSGGPAVINLRSLGELFIDDRLTIQGPGAGLLAINAYDPDPLGNNNGNGSRVFRIEHTISVAAFTVTISGLQLTGGDIGPADHLGSGGAIWNNQNLTLSNVVIAGNAASNRGGGVYHESTQAALDTTRLRVINSTISGNSGGQFGGGLVMHGAGEITGGTITANSAVDGGGVYIVTSFTVGSSFSIDGSTISANQAANQGGGLYSNGGNLTIADSTFSDNTAFSARSQGGGIFNNSNFSLLNVSGSTFYGNSANRGGGIYNDGTATVVNCTFSGNKAVIVDLWNPHGAGIFNNGGLTMSWSTIVRNVVLGSVSPGSFIGLGVYTVGGAYLSHNIIAENVAPSIAATDILGGHVHPSSEYNLIGFSGEDLYPHSGSVGMVNGVNGNQLGSFFSPIAVILGPLAANGGLTLTHALLPDSPAIDKGIPGAFPGANGVPHNDQRGAPYGRILDGNAEPGARIDIGAFEFQSAPGASADFDADGDRDGADFLRWQRGLGATGAAATRANGNADLDSDVDGSDFAVWRSQFGAVVAAASSAQAASQLVTADLRSAEPQPKAPNWDGVAHRLTTAVLNDPRPSPEHRDAAIVAIWHDRQAATPWRAPSPAITALRGEPGSSAPQLRPNATSVASASSETVAIQHDKVAAADWDACFDEP